MALGVPELSANATNSAALWVGGLGSAVGFWPQLRRTRRHLRLLLLPTALGSAVGVYLLVSGGERVFKYAVPALVLLATVLLAVQPQLKRWALGSQRKLPAAAGVALQFVICVYGGYFGAAQSVILLALLGILLPDTLQRLNGLKNVLAGVVNGVAAVSTRADGTPQLENGTLEYGNLLTGGLGLSLRVLNESTMCTMCMECVRSCDRNNVAVNLRPFGTDLLGKIKVRSDEAWMCVILLALTLFHGFDRQAQLLFDLVERIAVPNWTSSRSAIIGS